MRVTERAHVGLVGRTAQASPRTRQSERIRDGPRLHRHLARSDSLATRTFDDRSWPAWLISRPRDLTSLFAPTFRLFATFDSASSAFGHRRSATCGPKFRSTALTASHHVHLSSTCGLLLLACRSTSTARLLHIQSSSRIDSREIGPLTLKLMNGMPRALLLCAKHLIAMSPAAITTQLTPDISSLISHVPSLPRLPSDQSQ